MPIEREEDLGDAARPKPPQKLEAAATTIPTAKGVTRRFYSRRAADLALFQLDLDLAQLAHARLERAVVAVLDLHVDEVVLAVVHLHLHVRVVDLDGELGRLAEGPPARLHLDAVRSALVVQGHPEALQT